LSKIGVIFNSFAICAAKTILGNAKEFALFMYVYKFKKILNSGIHIA